MVGEGSDLSSRTPRAAQHHRRALAWQGFGLVVALVGPTLVGAEPGPASPPPAPASAPAGAARPAERGPIVLKPGAPGHDAAALDFKARGEAWFTNHTDATARRAEMRTITAALKQPCRHCHTPAFDGYTDRLPISRQMMALSAEHGVTCADCHVGKTDLTDLGRKSVQMWQLSHEQGVFCDACHLPGAKFEKLSPAGEKFKKGPWKAWAAAHPVPPAPGAAPASGPAPAAPGPAAPGPAAPPSAP